MDPQDTVEIEERGDVRIVRLGGEIDMSNIEEVGGALGAAANNPPRPALIVDLSAVTYLNSSLIKLLFDLAGTLRQHDRQLRVVIADHAPMRRLLLLVKLDLVVPLHKTVQEALAQIEATRKNTP